MKREEKGEKKERDNEVSKGSERRKEELFSKRRKKREKRVK